MHGMVQIKVQNAAGNFNLVFDLMLNHAPGLEFFPVCVVSMHATGVYKNGDMLEACMRF